MPASPAANPICRCPGPFDLAALLDALPVDGVTPDGRACGRCPGCGEVTAELRLRAGRVGYGFTYAAGGPHFEELGEVPLGGLHLEPAGSRAVVVRIGSRAWRFTAAAPSRG